MDKRILGAMSSLEHSKKNGLTYFKAKQALLQQGYTEAEINIASSKFSYITKAPVLSPPPMHSVGDQAIARHSARQQAIEYTRQKAHKQAFFGLLGGNSLFGQFFKSKAINTYADYKDLKEGKSLHQKIIPVPGQKVYQRNRVVKYYAIFSLIPLVVMLPHFWAAARIIWSPEQYIKLLTSPAGDGGLVGFFMIWMIVAYITQLTISVVFLTAKRERTIRNMVYGTTAFGALFFVILATLLRSPIVLLGVTTAIPGLLISYHVGLLSRLQADDKKA